MSSSVFCPTYFGPIDLFIAASHTQKSYWEKQDNYQKQTYRTRQYIYSPNGNLLLNIPILHPLKGQNLKQAYTEVKIDHKENWQIIHWRSLEAAYRSSPFFEFYEDEIRFLFEEKETYLYDFNKRCFETIADCLSLDLEYAETEEYHSSYSDIFDARLLSTAKRKPALSLNSYHQVFEEKHGFIPNLSILDLLFNL